MEASLSLVTDRDRMNQVETTIDQTTFYDLLVFSKVLNTNMLGKTYGKGMVIEAKRIAVVIYMNVDVKSLA